MMQTGAHALLRQGHWGTSSALQHRAAPSCTRRAAVLLRVHPCRALKQQQQEEKLPSAVKQQTKQEQQEEKLPSAVKQQTKQTKQEQRGSEAFWQRLPALMAGDAEKELSRPFRRTTFDHERWALHRSTSRYWRHIRSMLRSRVVKGLAPPLIYVGALSMAVCCYETLLQGDMMPDLGFAWPKLAIQASGIFSISTFALSLLLVFRTNSAYQRWNDARKLWGLTTNRCRDLSRQVTQWLTDPADAALVGALCRHIKAFPLALMNSLRNDHDLAADLHTVLQPDEVALLLRQPHPGTAVLQALGALLAASGAREVHKLRIDENLTVLQDTMGGCERIFRTPIPLFYTRHTSRFLICWLSILPFCTADQVGWLTVPIACGVAFFLLGIEEIGVQVEEPYGILALEVFCENIIRNVTQAEQAAAEMRGMAAAHAAGRQLPLSGAAASSSSGQLGMPPGWQLRAGRERAAGQRIAAAEEAFNLSCSTSCEDTAAAGFSATSSSRSSSLSSEDVCSSSSSIRPRARGGTSRRARGGASRRARGGASRRARSAAGGVTGSSSRTVVPEGGGDPSEGDAYRHSAVSDGALDDAEGFSF